MSIPQNLCGNCFAKRENFEGPCPFCGYDRTENEEKYPLALRGGSVLAGQYIVGHVLGQGGFGITYLAFDHLLGIKVAIKEFMPEGMGTRLPGTTQVTVYAGERQDYFNYGAERFLEEARVLAKFIGNRNIAGVKNFFNENNTSYFVMDYIEGISYKNYIKNCGGKIGYEATLRILVPVLRALADVHREGFIHRDVTPDNIIISKDGDVKLLDFGSARYNLGDKSKSLDVILKAGYAPKEQYLRHGKQGPWTDVYSVAACFYFSITGNLPPEALERMEEDELAEFFAYGIKLPEYLDDAIMKGLEINASDRFQSASEFLQAIEEGQKCEEEEKSLRDEDLWNQNPDESKQVPLYIPVAASVPAPSSESYVVATQQNVSARFTPISPQVKRLTIKKIMAAVGSAVAIVLIALIVYRFISDIKQYQDTLSLLDDGTDVNVGSRTELNNESNLSESGSSDGTNVEGITENSDGTNDEGIIGNSEENLEKISTLYIGQRDVPFGEYMWRVLDIQDGKALLISEDIVSERKLNQKDEEYVWENCDLRHYLNETFLHSFTQEEQNAIVEVTISNKVSRWSNTGGGEDTIDRIFLLSLEEVIDYFGDSEQMDDPVPGFFRDQYCGARKAKYENDWYWWWLRTSGWNGSNNIVNIEFDGGIHLGGSLSDESGGVRPALWIDISSYDFRESVLPTNLSIGQRDVLYGEYTWRVLDMQDGNALLLSEEIIEERAYHNEYEDCTWENCDLRKYLNESFLHSFTQEEQDAIVEVINSNDDNPWHDVEGGEATADKVFLLSIDEVVNYFGDSGKLDLGQYIGWFSDQYNGDRKALYGNNWDWWWLRSPGVAGTSTACVHNDGDFDVSGTNIDDNEGGVRPALWIHVDQ